MLTLHFKFTKLPKLHDNQNIILALFYFRNNSVIINQIIKALNTDDLAGIVQGFRFPWSEKMIKDFQNAIDKAKSEREFCSEEGVSKTMCTIVSTCTFIIIITFLFAHQELRRSQYNS